MNSMDSAEENASNAKPTVKYFIDLEWYREKERSFVTLAASRMCASTHDQKAFKSDSALLNTLKQCCSKQQSFTTPNMPLLELIFRVFLTNGNQALTLEQLRDRLHQALAFGGGLRELPLATLQRIMDNDTYYGLRPAR